MTEESKELLIEYEMLCKRYDPYYHYSDDPNVWRRGEADKERRTFIINYLSQFGLSDKLKEIRDRYYWDV